MSISSSDRGTAEGNSELKENKLDDDEWKQDQGNKASLKKVANIVD